jgi:hypothetical protein
MQHHIIMAHPVPLPAVPNALAVASRDGWEVMYVLFAGMAATSPIASPNAQAIPVYAIIMSKEAVPGVELTPPDFSKPFIDPRKN